MKTTLMLTLAVAIALLLVSRPTLAHHGGAIYDTQNPITLKAKVTEFTWANPHVQIYFDVTDEKGNIVHWACEALPPGRLTRGGSGWSKDVLKPGDEVTITISPAKTGAPVGNLRSVVLADGKKLMNTDPAPQY